MWKKRIKNRRKMYLWKTRMKMNFITIFNVVKFTTKKDDKVYGFCFNFERPKCSKKNNFRPFSPLWNASSNKFFKLILEVKCAESVLGSFLKTRESYAHFNQVKFGKVLFCIGDDCTNIKQLLVSVSSSRK